MDGFRGSMGQVIRIEREQAAGDAGLCWMGLRLMLFYPESLGEQLKAIGLRNVVIVARWYLELYARLPARGDREVDLEKVSSFGPDSCAFNNY